MKKSEIVVGGVYSDGKKGRRKVTAEGGAYRLYPSQDDGDCVQYEHLAGKTPAYPRGRSRAGNPLLNATRTSFAAWAVKRES